jgi:hypothetical protein
MAGLELVHAVLVSAVSFVWSIRPRRLPGLVVLSTGVVLVGLLAPERGPTFVAAALAGWILGECTVRGIAPERAFVAAVAPFALWTAGLVVGGMRPPTELLRSTAERVVQETGRRGDFTEEGLTQLRGSAESAIHFFERTWGAVQVGEFLLAVLAGWALARGLFRAEFAGKSVSFGRFEVPDELVWGFAGGLAAYLAGESFLLSPVAAFGLNVIVVTALVYFVRGTAIEWSWMERAGVSRPIRAALLSGAFVLFLPFHGAVTGGLGLFDTWFDFRRQRTAEEREDPFRVFHQSSGDDT